MSAPKEIRRLEKKRNEFLAIKSALNSKDGRTIVSYLLKTYCLMSAYENEERRSIWNESRRALAMQMAATAVSKDRIAEQLRVLVAEAEEQTD